MNFFEVPCGGYYRLRQAQSTLSITGASPRDFRYALLKVVRGPAYSPASVAEHTEGLILALNRKYHKAYNRIREGNFSLNGLMGFDLEHKTAGIIGVGKIGLKVAKILSGFGMKIIVHDPLYIKNQIDLEPVDIKTLYKESDIISLHCPLSSDNQHMIKKNTISLMKPDVMLINTSRGGLIDTHEVIQALKKKRIGSLAIDVYEQEETLFFRDHSEHTILDDLFERLTTFPNMLITGQQGFFTHEALTEIAETTLRNIQQYEDGELLENQVKP